jgi:hypothetical protein
MLGTHWELEWELQKYNRTMLHPLFKLIPLPITSHTSANRCFLNPTYQHEILVRLQTHSQDIFSGNSFIQKLYFIQSNVYRPVTVANVADLKALKDSWWCGYREGDELATKFWRFWVMGITMEQISKKVWEQQKDQMWNLFFKAKNKFP